MLLEPGNDLGRNRGIDGFERAIPPAVGASTLVVRDLPSESAVDGDQRQDTIPISRRLLPAF